MSAPAAAAPAAARQIAWFALVGLAAAAVHFAALLLLVRAGGAAPAWGNAGAFVLAFAVSFGGHYHLTFRHVRGRGWLASLWRWLASSLGGFACNQALFVLGLRHFGQAAYPAIWLAVTALVTLLTFVLARCWAFGRRARGQA